MTPYTTASYERRASSMITYWKVVYRRPDGEESMIFEGDRPQPVYDTGAQKRLVCAYQGRSLSGEEQQITVPIGTLRPVFKIIPLGRLPKPLYSCGQKLTLKDMGHVDRHVTQVTWEDGGWLYRVQVNPADLPMNSRVDPDRWFTETNLRAQVRHT